MGTMSRLLIIATLLLISFSFVIEEYQSSEANGYDTAIS